MMKEKLIRGITAALNGIYSIFKLFPVKKKITYISRQSNVLPVDFDLLQKLGKVLMTVIAVMPAAGLMISLGKLVQRMGND